MTSAELKAAIAATRTPDEERVHNIQTALANKMCTAKAHGDKTCTFRIRDPIASRIILWLGSAGLKYDFDRIEWADTRSFRQVAGLNITVTF